MESPEVVLVRGNCGTPSQARNALLDFVDSSFPSARWVARLDADDTLADRHAVEALCTKGETAGAAYVIGSNHLVKNGEPLPWSNIADSDELMDRRALLKLVESFASGASQRELPSCNLILRTHTGIRYPGIRGAEDHWLVAMLLVFTPHDGEVVSEPYYANYSLMGEETAVNQASDRWGMQRQRLAEAIRFWVDKLDAGVELLGVGQEGIVWREDDVVVKEFYPWSMDSSALTMLQSLLEKAPDCIPQPEWKVGPNDRVRCTYQDTSSKPFTFGCVGEEAVLDFLRSQVRCGILAVNIKRSNLRVSDKGALLYIDIGKDIVPFSVSRLIDTAARAYSICCIGNSDCEYNRRKTTQRQHEALQELSGFREFYRKLVESCYPSVSLRNDSGAPDPLRVDQDVTLLIKTCPQDVAVVEAQVEHIVSQLSYPSKFASVVMLVDTYPGPYLRQYSSGDLNELVTVAERMRKSGVFDQLLVAPCEPGEVIAVYQKWFDEEHVTATHTTENAPLFSQLWAFESLNTRYVLQCDVDVLVGRSDFFHDYLSDMRHALVPDDVLGVGFNISQGTDGFVAYDAEPGGYVPEIRCGLFDLERIGKQLPIENPVHEGVFELMWHRALEGHQKKTGLRCVRGGDSRTFYVHPPNHYKTAADLGNYRDLIAQGRVPKQQKGRWDLVPDGDWFHPGRNESIVFLLKGKATKANLLARCIGSLRRQANQDFGVIVIDDGGSISESWYIPLLLGELWSRTTLIRRRERVGYIPNFIEAVEVICQNPETLIVTLDQDDALMSGTVVDKLRLAIANGADLVNGAMFRPDKPLKMYTPDYIAPRNKGAANVWAHMRGFRKSLFEQVPKRYFQIYGKWIEQVTDYAIMLPMAELAENPIYIDGCYCYFHEREPYGIERKSVQSRLICEIVDMPSLDHTE